MSLPIINKQFTAMLSKDRNPPPASNIIWIELAKSIIPLGATAISIYLFYQLLKQTLLPDSSKASKKWSKHLALKLGRPEIEHLEFNGHEATFFSEIIAPSEIDVDFNSIGGLDDKLDEIKDNVLLPMNMFRFCKVLKGSGSLMSSCPTGLLLCK